MNEIITNAVVELTGWALGGMMAGAAVEAVDGNTVDTQVTDTWVVVAWERGNEKSAEITSMEFSTREQALARLQECQAFEPSLERRVMTSKEAEQCGAM